MIVPCPWSLNAMLLQCHPSAYSWDAPDKCNLRAHCQRNSAPPQWGGQHKPFRNANAPCSEKQWRSANLYNGTKLPLNPMWPRDFHLCLVPLSSRFVHSIDSGVAHQQCGETVTSTETSTVHLFLWWTHSLLFRNRDTYLFGRFWKQDTIVADDSHRVAEYSGKSWKAKCWKLRDVSVVVWCYLMLHVTETLFHLPVTSVSP